MRPFLTAAVAAALIAVPLTASAEWRRVARLTADQWAEIRRTAVARGRVDRLLDRYIPFFQVPAQEDRVVICENRGTLGLDCWTESRGQRCPSTVEVRIPGVPSPARVPVTCIGPDAAGMCECDFAPAPG